MGAASLQKCVCKINAGVECIRAQQPHFLEEPPMEDFPDEGLLAIPVPDGQNWRRPSFQSLTLGSIDGTTLHLVSDKVTSYKSFN